MTPELRPQAEPLHILVVEDDPSLRTVIAEQLRENHALVIEASNADEAWSYLEASGPVDLMFSDVQMPGTMDGHALARRVAERYPFVHIVLTSGAGGLAPFSGAFLPKPYRLDRAIAMLFAVLGRQPPGEQK